MATLAQTRVPQQLADILIAQEAMPKGVRAYQLRSRAARTSGERIEKLGSESLRKGMSTASTRLIGASQPMLG